MQKKSLNQMIQLFFPPHFTTLYYIVYFRSHMLSNCRACTVILFWYIGNLFHESSLSYKFTRFFIYFLFLSDEGPMLETLDHTIRIGSTPTFLYFDLYLYSAYAAHYVYKNINSRWRSVREDNWLRGHNIYNNLKQLLCWYYANAANTLLIVEKIILSYCYTIV